MGAGGTTTVDRGPDAAAAGPMGSLGGIAAAVGIGPPGFSIIDARKPRPAAVGPKPANRDRNGNCCSSTSVLFPSLKNVSTSS